MNKTTPVNIRFTPEQYNQLAEKAQELGLDFSTIVRNIIDEHFEFPKRLEEDMNYHKKLYESKAKKLEKIRETAEIKRKIEEKLLKESEIEAKKAEIEGNLRNKWGDIRREILEKVTKLYGMDNQFDTLRKRQNFEKKIKDLVKDELSITEFNTNKAVTNIMETVNKVVIVW